MSTRTARLRARHGSRMPRSSVLTTALASVAAIAGFSIVLGGAYITNAQGAIDRYDTRTLAAGSNDDASAEYVPTDFAGGEPINIVLIGTDERNDENAEIGGDVAEGMRGDTTMVVHFSADRSRIDVVSIPRDSTVRIADCEFYDGTTKPGWTGKFNEALQSGGRYGDRGEGAACVMKTITELTGVEFNGHFAMVDFAGFENMVDAMGGVPMCITQDMYSPQANLDLKAGAQVLDGETALAFARARKGDGLGGTGTDLARIDRQQELLTNLARKVLGSNVVTDLPALTQLIRASAESLSMDQQLGDIDNMVGLLYSLRNFDTANLTFVTVPWAYDGQGGVLWTEPAASELWDRIVNDEPLTGFAESNFPTAEETAATEAEAAAAASPSPEESLTSTDATDAADSDATETASNASDPEPSVTPSPVRETEEDILAECTLEY